MFADCKRMIKSHTKKQKNHAERERATISFFLFLVLTTHFPRLLQSADLVLIVNIAYTSYVGSAQYSRNIRLLKGVQFSVFPCIYLVRVIISDADSRNSYNENCLAEIFAQRLLS